jgi:hypothetical protein
VPTAAFAAKRLEYRANAEGLQEWRLPLPLLARPLALGALGLCLALLIDRAFVARRKPHRP